MNSISPNHSICTRTKQEAFQTDSFELLKKLLSKKSNKRKYSLDNKLPLILGEPALISKIFIDFIDSVFHKFNSEHEILSFTYLNENTPTISASLLQHPSNPESHTWEVNLVESISHFKLYISN
tara:strand:+ start:559 stop:930 length:372 start_codon:yes stop_codon:yes gene_type:complete